MRYEPTKLTELRLTDLPDGTWPAAEIPTGPEHWYMYATAYKDAADSLVDVMKEDGFALRTYGPPMLFMYRHWIELHLKSLLLDAGELLDDPQTVPIEHYLWKLWVRVRKLIVRVGNSESNEWIRRADQIIREFDALDPRSFAFRYPIAKDGSPAIKDKLLVDPSVVAQMMGELQILLNGASNQIAEYQGYKYEGY